LDVSNPTEEADFPPPGITIVDDPDSLLPKGPLNEPLPGEPPIDTPGTPAAPDSPQSDSSESEPEETSCLSPTEPPPPDRDLSPRFSRSLPQKSLKQQALELAPLFGLSAVTYDSLICELVSDRRRSAAAENFRESSHLNKVIEHVNNCRLAERKYDLQVDAVREYEDQAADFERRLREYDEETARLERDLRNELSAHRGRVVSVHDFEAKVHGEKWTSDQKRRLYCHASSDLRFLRRQFRLYMGDCNFEDAEVVKRMIDRAQRNELVSNSLQMHHDFGESRTKMKERHQVELKHYDDAATLQLTQLRQRRACGRDLFLNKRRKFEGRVVQIADQDKLWNLDGLRRKDEASRGSTAPIGSRTTKLTARDIPMSDDTQIPLPPLRITPGPRTLKTQLPDY
jgi:hypothetical protein